MTSPGKPKRWVVGALAALGLALIIMPFAFQMFTRAPQGAHMIAGFRPYMTAARLSGYQAEMRQIDAGVTEGGTKVAAALFGTTASADQRRFATRFPDFVAFENQWSGIYPDMMSVAMRKSPLVARSRSPLVAMKKSPPMAS